MKIKLLTTKELRSKKPAEILTYVKEMKKNRSELLDQIQTGKEKSTHQLSQIKRTIATAHTVAQELDSAKTEEEKK